MIAKFALLWVGIFLSQACFAVQLPNCVDRVYKFKNPRLPVKKDVLRNSEGCLFVINWGIEEGNKRPDFFDIRTSEKCEPIGKRLERAWRKSLLFKGEAVAHCQTRIRIKCPDPKKVCRIIFQLPEGDPVFDAS